MTAMICCCGAKAQGSETGFNEAFADSTLRIDYTLGAERMNPRAMVHRLLKTPGWAGRRHSLTELPLAGNGQLTLRDAATDSLLYRTSFSTLFQEWLATEEAQTATQSFEHTVLAPLPRRRALIELTLFDARRDTMLTISSIYDPADILVQRPALPKIPYRYVHRGGDPRDCIDVAILAEGYRAEEMDSFYRRAEEAAREILSYEPFREFADRLNFVAIASESRDSGVSVPKQGQWHDTAFGSHFSTFYSDRYLTTPSVWAVHDAASAAPYEHLIILANTSTYGGGGIYNNYTLTAANVPDFRPVVVHEFGHSFGGLADEYFYPGDVVEDSYPTDVEPWEPNVTTLVDFGGKWPSQLKKGTPVPTPIKDKDKYPVGVYEGAAYSTYGVYRPADQCRMRNNTYPSLCPVCTAALRRLIRHAID